MPQEIVSKTLRSKVALYRLLSVWPLLVWLGVAALGVWGYLNTREEGRYVGRIVQEKLYVTASEEAQVTSVSAAPGQVVTAGDLLATLDTNQIDLEIEALTTEIKQQHRERERRYIEARHRLIEQRQDLVLAQKRDQARLKVLEVENENLKQLLNKRLVNRDAYAENLETVEALRSSIEAYPSFIEELATEMEHLESSTSIWNIADSNALIEEDGRLKFLRSQREALRLKSPSNATVSGIFAKPGKTVKSGDAVVELLVDAPAKAVGFFPEADASYPAEGETLFVKTPSTNGQWVPARVTKLAPSVVMIPDQASPLPGKMITGRYCYLTFLQPNSLIDGETAMIAKKRPNWSKVLSERNRE